MLQSVIQEFDLFIRFIYAINFEHLLIIHIFISSC